MRDRLNIGIASGVGFNTTSQPFLRNRLQLPVIGAVAHLTRANDDLIAPLLEEKLCFVF